MSDSTSRVWRLLVERSVRTDTVISRPIIWSSKKNPTASRAGKGTPTPPAMTLVWEAGSNGAASRGCGLKQRETPPLQEQHGDPSDTAFATTVQRKSKAK